MTNQPAVRRVALHRREAIISPGKIVVRPAHRAVVGPLTGFALGIAACVAIWLGMASLPLPVLVLLLIFAVVAIPLAGTGLVYALIGAHVVIDAAKGSATWQQGMIGLGIGTEELVPFAKIAAIVIEEAGEAIGRPTEELAQWQVLLEKASGKRLVVGGVTAPRSLAAEALTQARLVASAIAELTGAPLHAPQPEPAPRTRVATPRRRSHRRRHGARR